MYTDKHTASDENKQNRDGEMAIAIPEFLSHTWCLASKLRLQPAHEQSLGFSKCCLISLVQF